EIIDIFVIKLFSFSSSNFSLDNFLLSLFGINQSNINPNKGEDVSLEVIKAEEIGVWMRNAKNSKDMKFLNSLSSQEQEKLFKTDVVLGNLLKSS
ncbi:MAG: hypothetical protein K2I71_01010, partial [Helicobacter sp.]|nr:hypothetical protein [Helicobacter sp.]